MIMASPSHEKAVDAEAHVHGVESDESSDVSISDIPATGCSLDKMPEGYYTSKLFLGTYFVRNNSILIRPTMTLT
jgi:hypothetical protein